MATAFSTRAPGFAGAPPVAPAVSVIAPVRNGARHIPNLLAALAAQTLPRERFEIVIGDDGSTDGSTDGVATQDGHVRVAAGPPQNSYAARNRAVRASRAPVLAFCDADCTPDPTWLESGLAALERADVVAGRVHFILPERPTIWTMLDMDATKNHERQVLLGNAETCNLFLRRELYDRVGGFDDTLPEHGDFDFASRCVASGARLVYAPEVGVRHPTVDVPGKLARRTWIMHRWYAARATRDGERPNALRLREWVPFVQTYRGRRRVGRPAALDREWLAQNGLEVRLRDDLRALPILYVLRPYLEGAAQVRGWWDGRKLA